MKCLILNPKITYVKLIKADEVNMENGVPTFIVVCGNANTRTSFALAFEKDYIRSTLTVLNIMRL